MKGRVKVQGFTVVFGVFIVPKVQLRDYHVATAEDTAETFRSIRQCEDFCEVLSYAVVFLLIALQCFLLVQS